MHCGVLLFGLSTEVNRRGRIPTVCVRTRKRILPVCTTCPAQGHGRGDSNQVPVEVLVHGRFAPHKAGFAWTRLALLITGTVMHSAWTAWVQGGRWSALSVVGRYGFYSTGGCETSRSQRA